MQVAADSQYPQINAGLFMPLDDRARGAYINKGDFFPSMWNSLIWNGKLYAIPLGGASAGLAYNKDIFDKAKIPYPTDDMDWNQVYAITKELTQGDGLAKQFGLAWDMWGEHWEWFNGGLPLRPDGIMTGASTDYTSLESNEGADSVTQGRQFRWKLMFDIKALPNAQEMQAFGQGTDMGSPAIFMGGHSAMNFDGSWSVATWQKGIKFNWDVARAPKWPNGQRSGWITVNGTGINAKTKFPEQAWTFNEFFSTKGLQILADAADFYPSKPSLVDAWLKSGGGTPKNGKVFSDSMAEGTLKRGSWLDLFAPGWGDTLNDVNACFDSSTGKGLNDIPPAQKAAEKAINDIIAKTKPSVLKQG
jgi:ABC-type glycerol-3-phosphate transport system substrate-binding protein